MKNVETLIKEAMASTDSTQGLKQWALNNGATRPGSVDSVRQVLTDAGYTGSIQDQWDAFLDGLGYTGDLTQKLRLFWLDGGNVGFDPLSLFASGEEGAWYDPSDLTTLFQDAAGTTPVTADSQPVRLMLDKSGNANHATAPSDAARPLYKTAGGLHWLAFDRVDDHFVTPTITPGVDKAQIFAGLLKDSDAAQIVCETSANASAASGALYLVSGTDVGAQYSSLSRGNSGSAAAQVAKFVGGLAPDTAVISATHDIVGDLSRIKRNGVYGTDSSVDKGGGNFEAFPLYIGRRAGISSPLGGNLYGLIVRFGANLDEATIEETEAYLAARTGVTV